MRKIIILVFVLVVVGLVYWLVSPSLDSGYLSSEENTTPRDTTYLIEHKLVKLVNGVAETEIAPGSSEKLITQIFGQSTFGDLNDDGTNDAVTFLTQSGGGSGTFYYAAIALGNGEGFEGKSAVLLGDRISPQSILVKDGVAMVNYAERKQGESMSTVPSLGVTKYLVFEEDMINMVKEFNLLNKGEQIFVGNIVMAHEARIFTPCGGTAHWVIGTSTAYSELTKAYNDHKATSSPYSSVYVVISGIIALPPTDGFGKDYNYGINVKNLLKVIPKGMCSKV
jgi:hypothetical protein